MSIVNMLFSPVGRIRRRDYWGYSICLTIVVMVINLGVHQFAFRLNIANYFTDAASAISLHPTPYGLYALAVNLALLWPTMCLTIKRWHDRNKTGWIAPAFVVFSYGLSIAQLFLKQGGSTKNQLEIIVVGLIALGVVVWQFVECGCLDGTKGPNKYGPSPKGIGTSADVF